MDAQQIVPGKVLKDSNIDIVENVEIRKDVCVVITGSIDVGKSSLLGVIISGELDDGKGYARSKIAKHPHEIKTGKTSDISVKTLQYNDHNLTLVDLCGHEKYLYPFRD